MNKRDFIKYSSYLIGGTFLNSKVSGTVPYFPERPKKKGKRNNLILRFTPYTLQLRHTFTLATSSRTTTPGILTEIEYDGVTGYGEASMPPYRGESGICHEVPFIVKSFTV
jgi:hypothetical protein